MNKTVLFGLSGEGGFGGLIAAIFVDILIPGIAGFLLGIFVFSFDIVHCIFLSGALQCLVSWISTLFDL